jgi:hypothetical protein
MPTHQESQSKDYNDDDNDGGALHSPKLSGLSVCNEFDLARTERQVLRETLGQVISPEMGNGFRQCFDWLCLKIFAVCCLDRGPRRPLPLYLGQR